MTAAHILFEDAHVVAVAKPAGLLVHRTEQAPDRDVLLQRVRDTVGHHVFPIHRLDRATSGVVLFGRTSNDARRFHDALKVPARSKRYLALARGVIEEDLTIDRPLTHPDTGRPGDAVTEVIRLGIVAERHTLVRVWPHTGRQHQIRRHLDRVAHQVIGDRRYGKGRINNWFRDQYGLRRMVLHAEQIDLRHPFTDAPLHIEAPLPEALSAFLGRLPDYEPGMLAP